VRVRAGEGFFFFFQKIEMPFSHYEYGINMPSYKKTNEECKTLKSYKVFLPNAESSVEDLERALESRRRAEEQHRRISKGGMAVLERGNSMPREKQLEMRIRLRKKLEQKKSKKK